MRQVTESDFRRPEFKDAKVEDYEFRADGKLVRKDRWEYGIRTIATVLDEYGYLSPELNSKFEIDDVSNAVRDLVNRNNTELNTTLKLVDADLEVFIFWLEQMKTVIDQEITDRTISAHLVDIYTQLTKQAVELKSRFLEKKFQLNLID